ncbi:MAG: hypothetical protein JWN94_1864 [Betaproteobacteria bacterium]|nr:hypothetical protein [Betaproteobacteria bacterium]
MVIYLDRYRTEQPAAQTWLKNGTYGNAAMNTGSNPAIVLMHRERAPAVPSHELPHDLTNVDVDAFLNRAYGLASLI